MKSIEMHFRLFKYIFIFPLFLTASCSTQSYIPPTSGDFAKLTIATPLLGQHEIYIYDKCQKFKLDNDLFSNSISFGETANEIAIPVDDYITVEFVSWSPIERDLYNSKAMGMFIEKSKEYSLESCSKEFVLRPRVSSQYNLIFSNRCSVKASEIYFDKNLNKISNKVLLTTKATTCR